MLWYATVQGRARTSIESATIRSLREECADLALQRLKVKGLAEQVAEPSSLRGIQLHPMSREQRHRRLTCRRQDLGGTGEHRRRRPAEAVSDDQVEGDLA